MALRINLDQDFRAAKTMKIIPARPGGQSEHEPYHVVGRSREFDAQCELIAKFRGKAKVRR